MIELEVRSAGNVGIDNWENKKAEENGDDKQYIPNKKQTYDDNIAMQ